MTDIRVTKRSGGLVPLDIDKMHKVVEWACEGLAGVSPSEVELNSSIQFYDGIRTADIQEMLIKSAGDLIEEDAVNYQHVAGNLINYHLRKSVYGRFEPSSLKVHYERLRDLNFYDAEIGEMYDDEEFKTLESFVDHRRDFSFTYAAMEQWRGKYLVQDRVTGEILETPQMALILIAATLFGKYPKDTRMKWVKDLYDALSLFDISFPTPIMAGVRTPDRQYSSCVLIETEDSLDSIGATATAILKYVSQKAGIGIGAGRIRAHKDPVRGGRAYHTGVTPYFRFLQDAVRSCSAGGIRNGAATLCEPIWHPEIEEILVLRNNKGIEGNRVRFIDYCIQVNKLFYERLMNGQDITLFSPHDHPEMFEAFFTDADRFKALYEAAEADPTVRKKVVHAQELWESLAQERKDTGRIYIQNVDHCNDHGSFIKKLAAIRQTNLCVEVTLPTVPMTSISDPDAEIAQCILAALNMGRMKTDRDIERCCTIIVRALDALISYQEYPVEAGRNATEGRRPIGVGVTNLAYWLAKNDLTYSGITGEGLAKLHEFFEAQSYYLIKASADLAVECGACPKSHETKYSLGILPIDTYKRSVDELTPPVYKKDWESLRRQLAATGIRNSTLMACMPSETSSQLSNATNGIEPIRALITTKGSKDSQAKQVAPESRRLKNKYDYLWSQQSPEGYLKVCAVIQKFVDQSMSVNTSYNPKHYPKSEIPMSTMLQDLVLAYSLGLKALYYFNTNDGAGDHEADLAPSTEPTDGDCDACKL